LFPGNAQVTLKDQAGDVSVVGSGVTLSNFSTTIANAGVEVIDSDATRSVSVDETCSPPGAARVFNTAHLAGTGSSVTVQGPQIGEDCTTDPLTGVRTCTPVYAQFVFACVAPVAIDDTAQALVTCDKLPPDGFNEGDFCTYTQGKYQASANNPVANYLQENFTTVPFPAPGGTGLLRIGVEDGAGPKHDAEWSLASSFRAWIGGGGPSGPLTADTQNATSTSGGTLAKQTGALSVNVALSGSMPGDPAGLATLKMCNLAAGAAIGSWTLDAAQAAALNGKTIGDILADANGALGGNGLPAYAGSFGDLNQLVSALNANSFDDCKVGSLAAAYLCRP
jgi:hypothetical protein